MVKQGYTADEISEEAQLWMRFIMQNYYIDQALANQGYQPVLPFYGCDGCCGDPLQEGGCIISYDLPIALKNDSL